MTMDCQHVRELISAVVDGEAADDDHRIVDHHLEGCVDCRAWQDAAHSLRRAVTVRASAPAPDLTDAILARAGVPDLGPGEWVRAMLGAISLTLLLFNIPLLVTGSGGGLSGDAVGHVGRHLGAFGVALAIGLGYAALRPERAIGLVPLGGALGATLLVTGIVDTATGASAIATEALHLLELAGVVFLWVLSGGRHRLAGRLAARRRMPITGLRALD
jgi:predicted anti-sigma-YlaC factor YlaD